LGLRRDPATGGFRARAFGEQAVRILVLGATGFIGSAACARLAADGHAIVAVSRSGSAPGLVPVTTAAFDIARALRPQDWLPLLDGVDAVVNCAGALQAGARDSMQKVHAGGPAALFAACAMRGVRRVVHLSAVGIGSGRSDFSETKSAGEAALMRTDLDWMVLRPSVVVGRSAYGGSALLRGLAALPLHPLMPDAGPLQLVHLDDVVETIARCVRPDGPKRAVLDLVGPRRYSLDEAVRLLRRWLRFRPAPAVRLPRWAMTLMARLGDAAARLGWRPPVRSNALRELGRGAVGDAGGWRDATGIAPRDVEAELAQEPASVQERWFARLYLLKALIFAVFGLFWLATGLISLGPGWDHGMGLLREGGLGETFAVVTLCAGALADIAIGAAILYRPTARYGLYAALAISLVYAVIGTILVPRLWSDPLGPMLKIWPVIVFNLTALAVLDDR
jgi:uncharacterized protein YbjT (DUF2867 family)